MIQLQIQSWLKAGILDSTNNSKIEENDQGTPQGGIISPLLSNIALHGLENFCLNVHKEVVDKVKENWQVCRNRLHLIRYADDFIVIHPSLKVIEELQNYISIFLKEEIDLELSESKTFISSTLNEITTDRDITKPGFNFVGFTFKIFSSKTYPAKNSKGKRIGIRPTCKPTFENTVKHINELRMEIKKHRGVSQSLLISKLSPIINGWTNYYRYCSAKRLFSYCDNELFKLLYAWALRRHPMKSRKWVLENYFHRYKKRAWVFLCYPDKAIAKTMPFHVSRKLEIYHRTKKSFCPFDKEQIFRVENMKLNKTGQFLYTRQKGVCRWCLATLSPGDRLEIHHTLGKNHPKREYSIYKWLIHGHCHDELHKEFKGQEFPYLKQNN